MQLASAESVATASTSEGISQLGKNNYFIIMDKASKLQLIQIVRGLQVHRSISGYTRERLVKEVQHH